MCVIGVKVRLKPDLFRKTLLRKSWRIQISCSLFAFIDFFLSVFSSLNFHSILYDTIAGHKWEWRIWKILVQKSEEIEKWADERKINRIFKSSVSKQTEKLPHYNFWDVQMTKKIDWFQNVIKKWKQFEQSFKSLDFIAKPWQKDI